MESTYKTYIVAAGVVMLGALIAGAVFFIDNTNVQVAAVSNSVELGIVELSPQGEAGGYAMPASGSSGSGCSCGETCTSQDKDGNCTQSECDACPAPTPAPDLPDLVGAVTRVTAGTGVADTNPSAGVGNVLAEGFNLTIRGQVTNIGALNNNSPFSLFYDIVSVSTGALVARSPAAMNSYSVAIGASRVQDRTLVYSSYPLAAGDYYARIVVDPYGTAAESNNSNNVSNGFYFTIVGPPGVPAPVATCNAAGDAVTVSWPVVEGATSYDLAIDADINDGVTFPGAGDHNANITTTSLTWPVTPGETFGYTARSAGTGGLSDFSPTVNTECTPFVDFTVTQPTTDNSTYTVGDTVTFESVMENVGGIAADPALYRFQIDEPGGNVVDNFIQGSAATPLAPNTPDTVSETYTPTTAGSYGVRIIADPTAQHVEPNEGDNTTDFTAFTVTAVPTQCNSGGDDDGDGVADLADPGCDDASDDDESDGAPDISAGNPSLTTTGTLEENRNDDLAFTASIANVGDRTTDTITYDFELDLGRDGSTDEIQSGSQAGGLATAGSPNAPGDSFFTIPDEVFADVPAGNHRVRVVVAAVSGEVVTSNNTSGWTDFVVNVATAQGFPTITADGVSGQLVVQPDSGPITIEWDTDSWDSCTLTGIGLPPAATATEAPPTIGADGNADVTVQSTQTFRMTNCTGATGFGSTEASVRVLVLPSISET